MFLGQEMPDENKHKTLRQANRAATLWNVDTIAVPLAWVITA